MQGKGGMNGQGIGGNMNMQQQGGFRQQHNMQQQPQHTLQQNHNNLQQQQQQQYYMNHFTYSYLLHYRIQLDKIAMIVPATLALVPHRALQTHWR